MTEEQMKALLDRLMEASYERDRYYEEDATRPEPGPPASPEQLAALERHWGRRLPPSYRKLLGIYNGISNFWFDVPLLSTQDVIDDTQEMRLLAEPFPELWRWAFACTTESYDALTFDPSQVGDDGELAVVLVGDAGEDARWPTLEDCLRDLLARVEAELASEQADREDLPQ